MDYSDADNLQALMEQSKVGEGEKDSGFPPPDEGWATVFDETAEDRLQRFNSLDRHHLVPSPQLLAMALFIEACSLTDAEAERALWQCDGFFQVTSDGYENTYVRVREAVDGFNVGYLAVFKSLAFVAGGMKSQSFRGKANIFDRCHINKDSAVNWADDNGFPIKEVKGLSARVIERIRSERKNAINSQDSSKEEASSTQELKIKKRVSTFGSGNAQVRQTCMENYVAQRYVDEMKSRETSVADLDIAHALKKAGGSYAVIGCLLYPESTSVDAARAKVKYLFKSAPLK